MRRMTENLYSSQPLASVFLNLSLHLSPIPFLSTAMDQPLTRTLSATVLGVMETESSLDAACRAVSVQAFLQGSNTR